MEKNRINHLLYEKKESIRLNLGIIKSLAKEIVVVRCWFFQSISFLSSNLALTRQIDEPIL